MREQLVIDQGPTVVLDGEPAQGTRHKILSGTIPGRDARVVVKVERIPGALERERATLTWLGTVRPSLAPRLVACGSATLAGARVTCLVTDRCDGSPPVSIAGWKRMGHAFAQLAELGYPDHSLPVVDREECARAHAQRIGELGSRLDPFLDAIPDWAQLSRRTLHVSTPLVLTHGDPGPGNYLDSSTGVLIDWEEAHVAPLGLDLARLIFIALLGSGPDGYPARDHEARANAVAAAYLGALQHRWDLTTDELRWWLTVAGIQFIHRRWQRGGQPAPWEQAAAVLAAALTSRTCSAAHVASR